MRKATYFFVGMVFAMMLLLALLPAEAHHRGGIYDIDITVEYPDGPPPPATQTFTETTILTGVSADDLLSMATGLVAAGSHQFDYSTTRWQMSLTGGFLFDEDEDQYSIGVGKRFGEESFLPNALFHGSYTPVDSHDFVALGLTIVF